MFVRRNFRFFGSKGFEEFGCQCEYRFLTGNILVQYCMFGSRIEAFGMLAVLGLAGSPDKCSQGFFHVVRCRVLALALEIWLKFKRGRQVDSLEIGLLGPKLLKGWRMSS